MNHLEAQSYIIPFINDKIPESKQEDFVMHMKTCKRCHEELEVYYTLLVGMRELDKNEKFSQNLSKEMDDKLDHLEHRVRNRKGVRVSAFSVIMSAAIGFGIIFYGSCISKVYNYEQRTKLRYQGSYYFGRTLYDDLQLSDTDIVEEHKEQNENSNIINYDRIRKYKDLTEQADYLIELTDDIARKDLGETLKENNGVNSEN